MLRDGMASAGHERREAGRAHPDAEQLAGGGLHRPRPRVISSERIDDLTERLESLEELLPDADNVQIDESMVLDLSGHESSEIEVVGEGGSMPTPAMVAWARELQVGSWYMLDYRDRNEAGATGLAGLAQAAVAVRYAAGALRAVSPATAGGVSAGRLAAAGAGRIAHRARHAHRAGQARRRSTRLLN